MRWWQSLMASGVAKCVATTAALTMFCALLYFTEYRGIVTNTRYLSSVFNDTNIKTERTNKKQYFYVNKYKIHDDELELYGNAGTSKVETSEKLVIRGLSHFLNQAKHLVQSDEKLEDISLAGNTLFSNKRLVKEINCKEMINGNTGEIRKAEEISKNYPVEGVKPEYYSEFTKNCSTFISQRGYITEYLTEVERDFPIAFSLIMFKDIEQSERLLRAIYRPQNFYCIHVDFKSGQEIYDAMKGIADCFENVFIAGKRYEVEWGTMSVLEPDLLCMEELWNKSSSWKYFINLTGQEFPLRTNYELVHILKAYNGANDLEGTIKGANRERWKDAGTPPHDIVPTKGSVHIVASRGYVDFVLHDYRAQDLLNWTRYTQVPDEVFFTSLNHNPHLQVPGSYRGTPETDFQGTMKPFVARFKNWGDGKYDWPCHGQRVRMICVFGTGDLPLLASRRELFANKFYLNYHRFALDCMEELHYNHTRDEYLGKLVFDPRWYSKLGFVLNQVETN